MQGHEQGQSDGAPGGGHSDHSAGGAHAGLERRAGLEQGAPLLLVFCCQAEPIAHCLGALPASYKHQAPPAPAVQPCPAAPVGLEPGTPPPPRVPGPPQPPRWRGGQGSVEGGGKAPFLPLCLEHLLTLPCNPQAPLPVPQDFLKSSPKVPEPLPHSLLGCSPGFAQT